MSSAEFETVWSPFVLFENTELSEATKVDEDTEMTITRKILLSTRVCSVVLRGALGIKAIIAKKLLLFAN